MPNPTAYDRTWWQSAERICRESLPGFDRLEALLACDEFRELAWYRDVDGQRRERRANEVSYSPLSLAECLRDVVNVLNGMRPEARLQPSTAQATLGIIGILIHPDYAKPGDKLHKRTIEALAKALGISFENDTYSRRFLRSDAHEQ